MNVVKDHPASLEPATDRLEARALPPSLVSDAWEGKAMLRGQSLDELACVVVSEILPLAFRSAKKS
jgi:hypothetical protein